VVGGGHFGGFKSMLQHGNGTRRCWGYRLTRSPILGVEAKTVDLAVIQDGCSRSRDNKTAEAIACTW